MMGMIFHWVINQVMMRMQICLEPTVNLQGTHNLFSLRSGKKITRGKFTELTIPKIVMEQVATTVLSGKQNKGLVFENRTGATVNIILPDDEANKAFNKIDGNIVGVDWEDKIQYPTAHMPQLNNNQYAALVGNEDNEENDTKLTGVENDGEITGVYYDNEITGLGSNNERTGVRSESGNEGATYEAD